MSDRDRKLLEIFVRENEGTLMAYFRTFARDPSLAEDLFQETMLTAWRRFDEFDTSKPLTPWLRGIAKNLIHNAWRKQSSDKLVFSEATAKIAESALAAVEKQSGDTWQERLSALADCIAMLPPKSKELVHASYTEGKSTSELSASMELNAATLRKRLQRIREQLADCVQQRLGEAFG